MTTETINPIHALAEPAVNLRDEVEFGEFETSLSGSPLWVSARGKHFQVRGVARDVLMCLKDGGRTVSEIHGELAKGATDPLPLEYVTDVVKRLASSSIVRCGDEDVPAEPKKSSWKLRSAGYFATYVPILSQERLRPVTTRLAILFNPYWVVRLLPILLVVQIAFWFHSGPRLIAAISSLSQSRFLLFLLCNYTGLFLHELGHAAACVRCGVKHGPIGFGIYLVFPAFYADVSGAWRLPNKERMLIDAAGVFVTLMLAWLALVVFLFTGSPVAEILTAVYGMTAFFSLNPFLRMDGYWLVSDALGIPNLMVANREVTEYGLSSLFRRGERKPQVWSLPAKQKKIYFAYYALFLGFVCYGTFAFYGWYVPRMIHNYPLLLHGLASSYHVSGVSVPTASAGIRIVLSTVPVVGMTIYSARFLSSTIGSAARAAMSAVQRKFAGAGFEQGA